MSFGKYTYGKPNIIWKSNNSKLVVGNFCSIANNCNIYVPPYPLLFRWALC